MGALEDAIGEIEKARDAVEETEVRTKLDSIAVSLAEMADTEAGELTDAEEAFGDADFAGAAPSGDNLTELEGELAELAESTTDEAREHLEAARRGVASYRVREREGDRERE